MRIRDKQDRDAFIVGVVALVVLALGGLSASGCGDADLAVGGNIPVIPTALPTDDTPTPEPTTTS